MILRKNKQYVKGSIVPIKHFRYILGFENEDLGSIYDKFKTPKKEVTKWCEEQYGKILYTWMLGTSDIHLHTKEDAMAFKLRWT